MSNFFTNQDRARRHTLVLILLFTAAVVLITLGVDIVGYLVVRHQPADISFPQWLLSRQGIISSLVCVGVIGLGSLLRFVELGNGGESVAQMVGARELDPSSRELKERQLRNVVEEMAIASGVAVPRLYVMDNENSINAFVAGYEPHQAVLVVTRGTLEQLNRDELQGVIGHEFSHILNGDMRINIRLIAILAGILMIGQVGLFLVRSGAYSSGGYRNSRNKGGGLVFLGIALTAIGYVGLFFGRLIKAAISRERELLADASSVQFTRNPEGIGGALYKIALHADGSLLKSTNRAEDMNHMCFGDTVSIRLSQLMATHPPIEQRLEAIDPSLLPRMRARFGRPGERKEVAPETPQTEATPVSGLAGQASGFAAGAGTSATLSGSVGTVRPHHHEYARELLGRLPERFYGMVHTTVGAVQLCYALGLSEMGTPFRDAALERLPPAGSAIATDRDILAYMESVLTELGQAARLPLLELTVPTLRRLTDEDRRRLIEVLKALAEANGRVTLFEFAMISFAVKHLDPRAQGPRKVRYRSYGEVASPLQTLLWLVARAGTDDRSVAEKVYADAANSFFDQAEPPAEDKVSASALQEALERLAELSPMLKPSIVDACGDCILADGIIKEREYELIRLVADQLDCPLPPLAGAPA